jgi:hypothetical protein
MELGLLSGSGIARNLAKGQPAGSQSNILYHGQVDLTAPKPGDGLRGPLLNPQELKSCQHLPLGHLLHLQAMCKDDSFYRPRMCMVYCPAFLSAAQAHRVLLFLNGFDAKAPNDSGLSR